MPTLMPEPGNRRPNSRRAGTAPNVISDQAQLDITVRSNSEATRAQLLRSIERVAEFVRMGAAPCYFAGNDTQFLIEAARREVEAFRSTDFG